ncbi:peroxiredoxin [Halodesulfovibrio aestuarii]|uniref:Peroxiredoxin n=1 Tax=Halodesulfovibrio aestuarii TaxID=126333 RepID=A0A8G2FBY8_9BACT|nr:peroxiredoxin [Halodesulfovibrio aestuarii]SHJ50014.1 1-Cys peroxiredoxin [Halodesulfovibrio aestuarii]
MTTLFPLLGDPLPQLTVKTTHGTMTIPDAMKGNWFILFSHPADFTPVCTTEFVGFQKRIKEFDALGCKLVGISMDQIFAHIKWIEWIKEQTGVEITFPVIADYGDVAEKLGMIHPGKGTNTVRAVFFIDPNGIVRTIFYYPQEIGRNISEILRTVRALQTSDKNKVAIPANWPKNELIGDRVIIPPAQTVNDAKVRLDTHEGYDWWFCHKELKNNK